MNENAFVKNAADEKQIRDAGKKVRFKRVDELNDVRSILSTKAGRRFIWRLLQNCGIYRSNYSGRPEDTFFREGERNIGLKLLDDINEAQPEAYVMMINESKQGEENG